MKRNLNKEGRKAGMFYSPLFLPSCVPYSNNSLWLVGWLKNSPLHSKKKFK
jgi:hypothetical protein